MTPIIELNRVNFSYGNFLVLEDVSFSIYDGEFIGIVGPNAGGKSTLLKLILGLLRADSGAIRVFGMAPERAFPKIGYVPQYPAFSRDFPIDVLDAVLLGRLGDTRRYGSYTAEDRNIALGALKAVEMEQLHGQAIGALSGGQLQRMLIARALASRPDVLVLDEPTANIDVRAEEDIFALLKQYNRHMTIIFVSHDIGFITRYVDRVICVNQQIFCHTTSEISGKTIEELYGVPVKMIQHGHS